MGPIGAVPAEHAITGLAEKEFSAWMRTALWYDLPTLAGHQIEQLVDEEGGRQRGHAAARDRDELAANRASEAARVSGL